MQLKDLSNKITSNSLNESLAKQFGYRLKLDHFTNSQLIAVQKSLIEQIENFQRSNTFDSVNENHEYQKNRSILDVIRQEIKERTLNKEQLNRKIKFLEGMKKAESQFEKKFGKNAKNKMENLARKMAKSKTLDEAMQLLKNTLQEKTLLEGEGEKAALIMSSRDMVDKVTGWLEDVASMKTETMLDLVDSIRDELGNGVAEQFSTTIKPALEELYNSLETQRTVLAQAVSILTGEEAPTGNAGAMPGGENLGAAIGAESPPNLKGNETPEMPEMPEMPPEPQNRLKRESIEYSRKLSTILNSKSKKK